MRASNQAVRERRATRIETEALVRAKMSWLLTRSRVRVRVLIQVVILCVLCVLCVEYTPLLDRDPGLVVIHLAGRLEQAPDDARDLEEGIHDRRIEVRPFPGDDERHGIVV